MGTYAIAARAARALVMTVRRVLRREVPRLEDDRLLSVDLEAVDRLIRSGELVRAAEGVCGPLHGISD